ncbi:hypothetical protein Tsubulata_039843 [Turnera subulata]|uniref:Protein LTV1 homolog n=1 Tax=Turnera subulata TaxID=218843 RepID=A0A9Q0G582_9ROSI|nr:hypothetical protein Tsubulata_039843 [Turnera subulata]
MGKKKFIDKKKSATFQLLARDSSTPAYDETPGSDRVFVRVDNNPFSLDALAEDDSYDHDDPDSIFADAPDDAGDGAGFAHPAKYGGGGGFGGASTSETGRLPENVRKEILELGFPDDGYNYLTHLREIKNTGGGSAFFHNPKFRVNELPLDVKAYDASRVKVAEVKAEDKNDDSMYKVASKTVGVRVQKVVDPEVAALLDDSDLSRFGSDIEDLEEDFVIQANLPESGEMEDVDTATKFRFADDHEVIDEETGGFAASHPGDNGSVEKLGDSLMRGPDGFSNEEPRVRRPLDEQFDMLELQEYGDDDEDGETGGYFAEDNASLAEKLHFALKGRKMDHELDGKYEVPADLLHGNERTQSEELDSAAGVIRFCKEYVQKYENEGEEKVADVIFEEESSSDESANWDCETIVSTYSNLDNHPAKIGAPEAARKKKLAQTFSGALNSSSQFISLRGKEKLPVDFLPHRKNTTEKVKDESATKSEQHKRKPHGQESKEEKKERKAAVKEERREARRVKKEMKGLYQFEALRAQKAVAVAGPSSIRI